MCLQPFPSPLEYRKAVPQALGASEERQPEGGSWWKKGKLWGRGWRGGSSEVWTSLCLIEVHRMAPGMEWQAARPADAGSLGQAACAGPEGHMEVKECVGLGFRGEQGIWGAG